MASAEPQQATVHLARHLSALEELVARWYRHEHDEGDFKAGLRAGWEQAIALNLGIEVAVARIALKEHAL